MVQTLVKSFSKMDFSELVDDINEDVSVPSLRRSGKYTYDESALCALRSIWKVSAANNSSWICS